MPTQWGVCRSVVADLERCLNSSADPFDPDPWRARSISLAARGERSAAARVLITWSAGILGDSRWKVYLGSREVLEGGQEGRR